MFFFAQSTHVVTAPHVFACVGIPATWLLYYKFHPNPFRGFEAPGGQNLAFPITLAIRFYNSLYLPYYKNKNWLQFLFTVKAYFCLLGVWHFWQEQTFALIDIVLWPIFHFLRWRSSAILDLFYACWDHPWRVLCGLYDCAKFGCNRRRNVDSVHILIFCTLCLKMPIHATKIGDLWGFYP